MPILIVFDIFSRYLQQAFDMLGAVEVPARFTRSAVMYSWLRDDPSFPAASDLLKLERSWAIHTERMQRRNDIQAWTFQEASARSMGESSSVCDDDRSQEEIDLISPAPHTAPKLSSGSTTMQLTESKNEYINREITESTNEYMNRWIGVSASNELITSATHRNEGKLSSSSSTDAASSCERQTAVPTSTRKSNAKPSPSGTASRVQVPRSTKLERASSQTDLAAKRFPPPATSPMLAIRSVQY